MRFIGLLTLSFLWSCNPASDLETDPYQHISDVEARKIIHRAIEHAGGLAQWNMVENIRYNKDFSLLLEDGSLEKSYQQVHEYHFSQDYYSIKSLEDGVQMNTLKENGLIQQTSDGIPVDKTQEALQKALNTSTFVLGMPFKLLDPGATLKYEGEMTLSDGKTVDVVSALYNAEEHDNHSSSDLWKFYFDQEDGKIVANWIKSPDHYSLVENLSFTRVNGILFNRARKSYRVDSLGNRLYLRAEYLYDNYEVD